MIIYREIKKRDNDNICNIIRTTLEEFGGKKIGTAYYDKDTERMFEAYQGKNEIYYVAEIDGFIVGGSGIKHLENSTENIAELQKLYLSKIARGLGIGKKLVEICIDFASKSGYESIYLETFPYMHAAINLYKSYGFKNICSSKGGTGHSACDVWMIKKLIN
ncbi:MAG: GNAT family N-acetyltransferase [Bacteroidales bacterium]|nr:GNAT family N-acetyltransferase [Bacteroidales bacterium]